MKNLTHVISGRFELLPFVYKRWCCGRDQQSVCIHDVEWLYFVFFFPLTTLAVYVCARYLPCFITTLVLSDKCSHCTCTLSALFSNNLGAVKGSCLCVCTLFALFPHNVGAVTQMQSVYMHAICSRLVLSENQFLYVHVICCPLTTLVLSDKPVTVCARYLLSSHNVGAVRRSCLCTARVVLHDWLNCRWSLVNHSGNERRV